MIYQVLVTQTYDFQTQKAYKKKIEIVHQTFIFSQLYVGLSKRKSLVLLCFVTAYVKIYVM